MANKIYGFSANFSLNEEKIPIKVNQNKIIFYLKISLIRKDAVLQGLKNIKPVECDFMQNLDYLRVRKINFGDEWINNTKLKVTITFNTNLPKVHDIKYYLESKFFEDNSLKLSLKTEIYFEIINLFWVYTITFK